MRHVRRGGKTYSRVADPDWTDPLDPGYAALAGGRWNAPGAFGVLYLNASPEVARANVARHFQGQPYGPEDLASGAGPILVELVAPSAAYVDALSKAGLRSLGLPQSYPRHSNGRRVSWSACQPVGQRAWEAAEPGIACRSAALTPPARGEELALFDRGLALEAEAHHEFDDWFWAT
ncbi:MAG: RES family NAD+ phosphorylase [Actinomycetota bacterium]|nr:RES family NAD+ phosphorylase [Actinomycetota bacterium]